MKVQFMSLPFATVTPMGPLLWQAKQTVSALCQLQLATKEGQLAITMTYWR